MSEPTVLLEFVSLQDDQVLAHIRLNKPRTLNALDHDMIRQLLRALDQIEADSRAVCVWIDSVTERAFCAGGDVRDVTEQGRVGGLDDLTHASAYLADEYLLDLRIRLSAIPVIAWGDGYIMGGGMGVFQAAQIRCVTPHSQLAMPEVRIGFIPDCGGSWFLNRVPYGLGQALAMSGVTVNANDALYLSLADWLVPREAKSMLFDAVCALPWRSGQALVALNAVLQTHHQPDLAQSPWAVHGLALSSALRHLTPEQVWDRLDEWAHKVPALLDGWASVSPGAALIAGHQWQRARLQTIGACVVQEHDLGMRLLQDGEWCEGVRALLVDKDKAPRWRYRTVAEVETDWITAMMTPMKWSQGHPLQRALAAHGIAQ
ncbi:MAG: enoyl-CoA hydratase/isomerase family protein [Litorivicinaceae bacterium]